MSLRILSPLLLLLGAACAVPKPPPELIEARNRVAAFQERREVRVPPRLALDARRYLQQAEDALARRDVAGARHYATLARIRAETARVIGETARLAEEVKRNELRFEEANLAGKEASAALARVEEEIAQLEKILVAQARAAASEAIGKAKDALRSAENADAPRHAPNIYERARKNLAEAEIAFEHEAFEKARIVAQGVRQDALSAMNRALAAAARLHEEASANTRKALLARLRDLPGTSPRLTDRGIEFSLSAADLFRPGSDELRLEAYPTLDPLADILSDTPTIPLLVEGYHNEAPTFEENFLTSKRRAERIKRYFVEVHHIAGNRITSDGFGDAGGESRIVLLLIIPAESR